MPTMPPSNSSKASSSKKRKSAGQDPNRPAKQSKINSYFPPLHPISPDSEVGDSERSPLNEEQKKVFRMVVNEGKTVFFTGAAGTLLIHIRNPRFPSLTYVLLSTRNGEIAAAPGYHHSPQEETREESGCRICDSQHRDGRFKHWRYVPLLSGVLEPDIQSILRHLQPRGSTPPPGSLGTTIHYWGGVTPNKYDLDNLLKRIQGHRPAVSRWRTTKVLIIDEGEHLDSRSHLTM